MNSTGERFFRLLLRAYPREFRERYRDDLVAFFRQERRHPRYGSGPFRSVQFWTTTLRDLARAAAQERFGAQRQTPGRHSPAAATAGLLFDMRDAIRSLRSTPAVTLTALAVLTLAIGAGTAIFAVVDTVVLRDVPFADPSRLVAVNEMELPSGRPVPAAYQNFADWSTRQDVFESIAASSSGPLLTTVDDRPEQLRSYKITANLIDLLRVRPALGPGITSADERSGTRVALLSDSLWRRRFHADPTVIGRQIKCDSGTYVIAGVMPQGFKYPIGPAALTNIDLWIPLTPAPRDLVRTDARTYSLRVIGRLKPGVSLEEAATRMQQIRDALAAEHPKWFTDHGILVRPIKDSIVTPAAQSWMMMLLGAVTVVFLVACANLANLLLARMATRSREIGVRTAMGATRSRIVRGLLVESVVLALAGAAGGIVLAFWGVDVLRATLPANLSRVGDIVVDLRVLAVATLVALATGLVCGLLPAVQLSRVDTSVALRASGRSATAPAGPQRVRSLFLAVEVAFAAILLVGAGIFASSFMRLVNRDLGFSSAGVLSVGVNPKVPPDRAAYQQAMRAFQRSMRDALDRIRAVRGVESAALVAGGAPLTGSWATQTVTAYGRKYEGNDEVVLKQVTSGYFETVGATLLQGRGISPEDRNGAPPVIVLSEEAVRRYLGGRDPLGAQISLESEAPRTVIGVVRGMRLLGPEAEIVPEGYVPYEQSAEQSVSASIVIRTTEDPARLLPSVKDAIWSVMPGVVIPEPRMFEEMFATLISQRKLNMMLLGIFGALALLIASIGIYGMLAYLVAGRTKEIGVRMALGAVPAAILRMILGRASLLVGAGLTAGFLAAVWLERLVMAFVFDGIPHDPIVYSASALLLMAVGLLAAFIPARRAAKVDPLVALRAE